MNAARTALRNLLAPERRECVICNGTVDGKEAGAARLELCRRCYGHIPWISPEQIRCRQCGRAEPCPDCVRRSDVYFVCNRSAVRYTEEMKEWLGRFKYRGDERLSRLWGEMMAGVLANLLAEYGLRRKHVACLTYVPLSPVRLAERGFNQTELIAQQLGRASGIPVKPLLIRTRHTGKQSYKSRAERLQDLQGAFAADPEAATVTDAAKPVILIDDVYTTGSTMNECARAIAQTANCSVFGLTWAR